MHIRNVSLTAVLFLAAGAAAAQQKLVDRAGFKDPQLFTRMPNFYLSYPDSVVEKQFGGWDFEIAQAGKSAKQRVEGHYWYFKYRFDETSGPFPSGLQIVRNYQAAAARIGGKVMDGYTDGRSTTLLVSRNGNETWAYVLPYYGGKEYHLIIVERQAMKQDVVADASALRDGLSQNGHVEIPGIYFDFAKPDIKPESEPALRELVKLLQGNPSLRVWVVGHTDNVGSDETNVVLSNARAAAVVNALVQRGIQVARLAPHGVGPYAPVASNATEEGRAHNRRVELVARP